MSAALLTALTFVLVAPWGGPLVHALLEKGIGKNIRFDGPASHQRKAGTATMGGILFLVPALLGGAALAIWVDASLWAVVVVMLVYGLLGAVDDYKGLHDRKGVGWLARYKFVWQWVLALLAAGVIYLVPASHILRLPLSSTTVDLGGWTIPIAALLIVALGNAVNLTDGLDGLAGGTSLVAYAMYGILALMMGQQGVGLYCALLVGGLLAFLWHNAPPASMFMGDVGAEALGAGLAAVAMLTGQWLLLPLIGVIFVAEALSDIIQVSYFKWTRRRYGEGRRVFKMAPLHHHFELLGWAETRIVVRFWLVSLIGALVAFALRARGG